MTYKNNHDLSGAMLHVRSCDRGQDPVLSSSTTRGRTCKAPSHTETRFGAREGGDEAGRGPGQTGSDTDVLSPTHANARGPCGHHLTRSKCGDVGGVDETEGLESNETESNANCGAEGIIEDPRFLQRCRRSFAESVERASGQSVKVLVSDDMVTAEDVEEASIAIKQRIVIYDTRNDMTSRHGNFDPCILIVRRRGRYFPIALYRRTDEECERMIKRQRRSEDSHTLQKSRNGKYTRRRGT